jgi:integrase
MGLSSMKKVRPIRTTGPLHFEDLDPHRFEDLVRRLIYDFRPWRHREATGVLGPTTGKRAAVHHKALNYRELPAFMATLRKRQGQDARAMEFLILCASRTGEVLGAKWSEINLKEKMWTIPANRMKDRKEEHRVALSDRVMEILKVLPREAGNDFVFIGSKAKNLSPNTFTELMKKLQATDTATPHGFRATFKTWASEQTSFAKEIIEQCLAHAVGNATERSYQRSDLLAKRRSLLAQWERFCVTPFPKSKVIPIRG